MEKRRTHLTWSVWIVGVVLVMLAVAAASFFAGTVVAKRAGLPQAPPNGASPPSELVQRVSRIPGVTSAVEARSRDARRLFVIVETGDWSEDEKKAFLEKLLEAVGGELPREGVVVVSRKGGEILPWDLAEGTP